MPSIQIIHVFKYEHEYSAFFSFFFFDSLCIVVVLLCSPLKCVNHVDFRKQAVDSKMTTKPCVLLRCQIYTVAQLHVHLQDSDQEESFCGANTRFDILMITMF